MDKKILKRIWEDQQYVWGSIIVYYMATFLINQEHPLKNGKDHFWNYMVVGFCIYKISFFLLYIYEVMWWGVKNNKSFRNILLYIWYIVMLIQVSFALDYFYLFSIQNNSFKGLSVSTSYLYNFCELLYFSVITMGTIGYGDIVPQGLTARSLVSLEVISYLTFIILIIANYSNLKDAFNTKDPNIGDL